LVKCYVNYYWIFIGEVCYVYYYYWIFIDEVLCILFRLVCVCFMNR